MANGASVIAVKEDTSREVALDNGVVPKESPFGNDEHLCIILSQETYDTVMEVVTRASERGLVDTFDYWLNSIVKTGAQAKLRTWNDRDVVSLFNTVQNSKLSQSARRAAATKLQKLLEV